MRCIQNANSIGRPYNNLHSILYMFIYEGFFFIIFTEPEPYQALCFVRYISSTWVPFLYTQYSASSQHTQWSLSFIICKHNMRIPFSPCIKHLQIFIFIVGVCAYAEVARNLKYQQTINIFISTSILVFIGFYYRWIDSNHRSHGMNGA